MKICVLHYLRTCFCTRQHTLQYTKNGCVANFFATKTAIQATIFFDTNDNKFCNNVKGKPKREFAYCTVLRGTCFCARQHTLQHTKNGCVANFFATKTAIQANIFFDTNDNKFCNNINEN